MVNDVDSALNLRYPGERDTKVQVIERSNPAFCESRCKNYLWFDLCSVCTSIIKSKICLDGRVNKITVLLVRLELTVSAPHTVL